ncbi:MAG: alcohol dehydrogenase catalytic domain-containing protein [Magnetococcales bacterium]|nr:alcohol dehydrogenase catalytic domain-containing protein [Magnetococcales bacterium]
MQALVINKGIHFDGKYPQPLPKPGEAVIKTLLGGICATDIELLKGYADFNGVAGHEFVGIVEQADNPALIGKRVVGEINTPCNSCPTCNRGDGNHCPNRLALGIRMQNGVFAERFTLSQANLHLVPDSLSDRQALFTEPLAAALEILSQIHIGPKDSVAILGDGKLGLLIAQVLALTGCDLLLIGRHPERLKLLTRQTVKACSTDQLPKGYSAKIVVECTGNSRGFAQARKLVQPRGCLVLKSSYSENCLVDLSSMVVDEITLIGSRCGPFAAALRLLESGLIETEPLIEAEFSLNQGVEAFETAQQKGTMKVLLRC